MHKAWTIVALGIASSALALGKTTKAVDAQEAAQSVLNSISDAFNKGDPKAVASVFVEDGNLINPLGVEGHGRNQVEQVVSHVVATVLKGTQNTLTVASVRPVGADALWVDAAMDVAHIKLPGSNGKFHLVMLLVKQNGKWSAAEARLYAFLPKPPPGAEGASKTPTAAGTTTSGTPSVTH